MISKIKNVSNIIINEGVLTLAAKSRVHGLVPVRNTISSRYPSGENIFSKEWDLMVILDACRVDTLRKVSEYKEWIGPVYSRKSVGSTSAEWVLKTFDEKHREAIQKTGYVTANPWYNRIIQDRLHETESDEHPNIRRGWPNWSPVSSGAFSYHEYVTPIDNQDTPIHPESNRIPHVLTDRAISVGRSKDLDRLIVHYMFPHLQFITDAVDWTPGESSQEDLMAGLTHTRELRPEEKSYTPVKKGDVPRKTVHNLYCQNLRLGLDYVDILLRNVDAETTVISSDHGEMLGEFGLWDHTFANPFGPVKKVPWVTTTAQDTNTYKPTYDPLTRSPTDAETEDFLKNMGYV